MKTYDQLTEAQQQAAVNKCLDDLLELVICGALRFNGRLNGDDLQARINAAGEKANDMQTPWFAGEYILDVCREELEAMARTDAMEALYAEREHVIHGIAAAA